MILPGFRFLWSFSCECPLLFVTLSPRNRELDETDIFFIGRFAGRSEEHTSELQSPQ